MWPVKFSIKLPDPMLTGAVDVVVGLVVLGAKVVVDVVEGIVTVVVVYTGALYAPGNRSFLLFRAATDTLYFVLFFSPVIVYVFVVGLSAVL